MSEFKVDFKELKKQIDGQKTKVAEKEVALGRVPEGAIAKKSKRAFLNELVTSMHHGTNSSAIETIRSVSKTVEAINGLPPAVAKNTAKFLPPRPQQNYVPMNENVQPQQPVQRTAAEEWGIPGAGRGNGGYAPSYGGSEREDLFEQNLQRQMAEFDRRKMSGNPVATQLMQQQPQYAQQPPQYVVEQNVAGNQVITEDRNLEKLVEGAFKNVLTEIYTKNKIQEALSEFLKSDDFEKIVANVILRISKRNKK